ncbi:MAG: SEC-C metal-binding domain-containing protein [Acidobacteriota bacterium]|nr:SEC-C metal-binding domain-containing protein [Acidobacteriota bacterium]
MIDLLISEEDRVTPEHIQELVRREDAVEPLRVWMRDENRWREARDGEWWALYHAFTILSLTKRIDLLPDLLQGFIYANEEDFDWLMEVSAAALAQCGEAALNPLIEFIRSHRPRDENDWKTPFLRSYASIALARIALENPDLESKVADFFCSCYSDLQETDGYFLGSISGHALMLDKERVLEPMRAAFERGAVDETIAGDFEETLDWFDPEEQRGDWEYYVDLLKFYQPDEIANRQSRWKKEKEEEERRARQQEANSLFQQAKTPALVIPQGYFRSDEGNLLREPKIGRNDPCPCLSGKKYKKCCGK